MWLYIMVNYAIEYIYLGYEIFSSCHRAHYGYQERRAIVFFFFFIAIDCGGAVKIKTWPRRKKWGWFYLSISIDKNKKKKLSLESVLIRL